MSYNPNPTRAWSRVQSQCTFINNDTSDNNIFIPLLNKTLTSSEALYYDKLQYKGNILQYKANSIGLTKRQKYAQLAKGLGPSRTKVFATQTQTYTNPNTSSLLRVNTVSYTFPNSVPGQPNNPAGPFQYNVPNPNSCPTTVVVDGGNLINGVYANPCTNAVIKDTNVNQQCFPTYCSDVPGKPELLCWNPKQQTFFPRQRVNMNNSADKWPEGYKGFVSAIKPNPPYLMLNIDEECNVNLSWKSIYNNCIPITSYNIYENGILIENVPNTTNNVNINVTCLDYNFYVTALSGILESVPSNYVYGSGEVTYNISNLTNTTVTTYNNNGYYGIVFDVSNNFLSGSATINFCKNFSASILVVGGGGGGACGDLNPPSPTVGAKAGGGGGGGGGITYIQNYSISGNSNIPINIGYGGKGRSPGNGGYGNESGGSGANSTFLSIISYGGGGGLGDGTTTGRGGGVGGNSSEGLLYGYGGGGGGGAYSFNPSANVTIGGTGGSGYLGVNPGITGATALGGFGGNGGSSSLANIILPFTTIPTLLKLGGGGGGGGSGNNSGGGGGAGNGLGGSGGLNTSGNANGTNALFGLSNGAYGGGGGGGGVKSDSTNIGGNGGNGTVIIWWKKCVPNLTKSIITEVPMPITYDDGTNKIVSKPQIYNSSIIRSGTYVISENPNNETITLPENLNSFEFITIINNLETNLNISSTHLVFNTLYYLNGTQNIILEKKNAGLFTFVKDNNQKSFHLNLF